MPQENVQQVSKRIRRIPGKYLSVHGEHGKLGLFAVHKIVSTRKVFKPVQRMRGKNLCLYGEDAKRLLAYSPNMPKDIKVGIYCLIIIRIHIQSQTQLIMDYFSFRKGAACIRFGSLCC